MATSTKATKVSKEKIIERYMQYVLEHETVPRSIFKFCKEIKIKEEQFYEHFGSFDGLQKEIWKTFFDQTMGFLGKNKEYGAYANREKMLSFFFTFFELLTLNRSYVLFALKEHHSKMESMAQLKGLRSNIKDFATELIQKGNEGKTLKITKQNPVIFSEGAWVQFLFLLKFWMEDSSPRLEKTDMAIEKSVNTIFDLFDNTPLDSIVDFGKFLYKETFA
ncbi:TetR family transcriptional regulator C-terminal domain-containing protein [Flagellimonas lutaonensis]|uniref:Heat-shock protein n=1 Tax=Flagellimonas lutaonensis TaxID=516051 RepID=A0A0D5YVG6_9FLAO|nr:TetR/AcrR family transcriptional regulator [Allomuricauda lutaonensis]AKA35884.1 heat-shock protein [Allomuricauda lutaonensis]